MGRMRRLALGSVRVDGSVLVRFWASQVFGTYGI